MRRLFCFVVFWLGLTSQLLAVDACATFGFDTNSLNNFQAMQFLEDYLETNATPNVITWSTAGVYKVALPDDGDGASIDGASDFTLAATNVIFYSTNLTGESTTFFTLNRCTNATLQANFQGLNTNDIPRASAAPKAVWLLKSNYNITLSLNSTQMFESLRTSYVPDFQYNANITATLTNLDCYYGAVLQLSQDITITNWSVGTVGNDYGAHRSVYIQSCTNVTAYSWSKDLNVPDNCNVITSGETIAPVYHAGCSNITLYATDMGTTHGVTSQSFCGVGVVTGDTMHTNMTHDGINLHLNAIHSTVWTNDGSIVEFYPQVGVGDYIFTNVVLSGTYQRFGAEASPAIRADCTNTTDVSLSLYLYLTNFYDLGTGQTTIYIPDTNVVAAITGRCSTIQTNDFSVPAQQTWSYLGCPSVGTLGVTILRVNNLFLK